MSEHWSSTREAGVLVGMRFMIWVNSTIGRGAFTFILAFVMAYFFLRRGPERRASRQYLARLRREYPDALSNAPLAWLSYKQFFTFGQALLDKYLAWAETPDRINMDPAEEKVLFDAAAGGRGCLLIGSHFGNLEYSRGIAHRHPDLVINVLLYDRHALKFAGLIEQGNPESRMNLIQVTDVDFKLALELHTKVEKGEWVVIAGDRVPIGDNERECDASFLGDTARFPVGPYVLASLLQCPVFLLHCFKLQGEYHLGLEHFAERIEARGRNRQAIYEQHAQAFATALEKQVVREPLQWFNFFDFWDTGRSAGAAVGSE